MTTAHDNNDGDDADEVAGGGGECSPVDEGRDVGDTLPLRRRSRAWLYRRWSSALGDVVGERALLSFAPSMCVVLPAKIQIGITDGQH